MTTESDIWFFKHHRKMSRKSQTGEKCFSESLETSSLNWEWRSQINCIQMYSQKSAALLASCRSVIVLIDKDDTSNSDFQSTLEKIITKIKSEVFVCVILKEASIFTRLPEVLRSNPFIHFTILILKPDLLVSMNLRIERACEIIWAKVLDLAYDLGDYLLSDAHKKQAKKSFIWQKPLPINMKIAMQFGAN